VIGITATAQEASFGVWRVPAALVPLDYVTAVERAGGRPILIPPSTDGVAEALDAVDGLVFSGGADVDPTHYGADAHPETDEPQAVRDAGELALLRAALERDLPVLAICRGFQLLNVVRGGDLVQHLPEAVGHDEHRHVPGQFSEHPVEVQEGTRLASLIGARSTVASHHHQAIGKIGEGLVQTAWAKDGTLEALEDPSRRFAVGVQWHPEAREDRQLFEGLVREAVAYRAARSPGG
jgi:gamma-glutamyl-gamma-aminobutyrate hydrolase PuuD